MTRTRTLLAVAAAAAALLALAARPAPPADTGASLYSGKCAMCHKADGTGNPALHAPSLVSAEAKAASDADLTDMIGNGGKAKLATHAFAKNGLSAGQIKLLVAYLRELQSKAS